MSSSFVIRSREQRPRHRQSPHRAGLRAFGAGFQQPLAAGASPEGAPHLAMPAPPSARDTWVSATATTVAHLLILLFLFWLGLQAKDVVEELIPVTIVRELPGSNEAPAPAPRKIVPRRSAVRPAAVAARPMPQMVKPIPAAIQTPQAIEMAKLEPVAAPRRLDRRQVESRVVDARAAVTAPRVAAIDASQIQAIDLDPSQLTAPQVEYTGPTRVADGRQVDTTHVEAFAGLDAAREVDHTGQAELTGHPIEAPPSGEWQAIDTGIAGEFSEAGAAGVGGQGTALGVTECLSSAFVLRYLDAVEQRTKDRWIVPEGTLPDAIVKLRFRLDASGSASELTVKGSPPPELGSSVIRAMRDASPFPPMTDDVRCLSKKTLTGTFAVPEL